MTWLNPMAFAFLAFIPVIILLHSLRYRRRDLHVSTLFLWESVAREARGSLGIWRLVSNVPLLLQILLIILLTAALANPVLIKTVARSQDILLVIDVSASMQTRTPQGTRFTQAQQLALQVLAELPRGREMALLAADHQPQVLSYFTSEKELLYRLITGLQASDSPGHMREAVLLALSFNRGRGSSYEVVVIGDGAYHRVNDPDFPRHLIRHIQVTGGERNVGITRLAFRKLPYEEDLYEVLMAVKNYSGQALEVPVQLSMGMQSLLERRLHLPSQHTEVLISQFQGQVKGLARAEIFLDDNFTLDNQAYGVLETKTLTRVLLVGQNNYFFEKLLTSIPGVLVEMIPEVSPESLPRLLELHHLIIFNGVQPPPLRRGNFLLINTVPQDERLRSDGVVSRPVVIDWDRQHPLLRFVKPGGMVIEEALALYPRGGAQSLIDGEGTSLLSLIQEPQLRLVTLAFDPMRSDLPLRVAFPLFMGNLLRWLKMYQGDFALGQIQAGKPYAIYLDPAVERVEVQDPQGKKREYRVGGNPWVFTETNRIGMYTIWAGQERGYLAVSLLDEGESDINPVDRLPSMTSREDEDNVQTAGLVERLLWPYFILAAAVVLLGEWYFWCRDF